VSFFSIKLVKGRRAFKTSVGWDLSKLWLYRASDARGRNIMLTLHNSSGRQRQINFSIIKDGSEDEEKEEEEERLDNRYKNGYWLTTWNINDMEEAFGSHAAFHGALARDELMKVMRSPRAGLFRSCKHGALRNSGIALEERKLVQSVDWSGE
jgi:hypothetical protein